jgi:hypothetical protein
LDDNNETRRQRNDRVGEHTPPFSIPSSGKYLWEWFNSLNNSISRIQKGVCYLMPPSEIMAWSELTGNIVYSEEYDIISSMDRSYCEETNKEFISMRSKQEEEQKRQVEEARNKKGRK